MCRALGRGCSWGMCLGAGRILRRHHLCLWPRPVCVSCGCAASEGAAYYCVITDLYGSTRTSNGVVRVAPAITTQPLSTSKLVGASVTFSVVATGPSLTYNWQRNGVSAGAASAASYSYTPTVSEIGTTIAVTCVVSGVCGPSRWCLYACVPRADCKAHGSWCAVVRSR